MSLVQSLAYEYIEPGKRVRSGVTRLIYCYNFKNSFVIIPREHRPQHRVQQDTSKNDRRSFLYRPRRARLVPSIFAQQNLSCYISRS